MKSSGIITALLVLLTSLALTSCFKSELPVTKLKTTYANGESQFAKVKGMEVHFRDEGPQRARPVLLLHEKGLGFFNFLPTDWVSNPKFHDCLFINYKSHLFDPKNPSTE